MANQNDPTKIYYASFKGNSVELRNLERRLIRKFTMRAEVVNAQVSGYGEDSQVAIVMKNGKTEVYSASGRLVRR